MRLELLTKPEMQVFIVSDGCVEVRAAKRDSLLSSKASYKVKLQYFRYLLATNNKATINQAS